MNQSEKRRFLIGELLNEEPRYRNMAIPSDETEQKRLLRSLMNIRAPKPIGGEFLRVQNEYLQEELGKKHVTDISELMPAQNDIYIWKGDITTLKCGAIVNAANSGMTGCYYPCHGCIDNCIHTYAGVQLRLECGDIMKKQGYAEPAGQAKITKAYNLPCEYVIHTVGPIVTGKVKENDKELLSSCYTQCLKIADENNLKSIAFCCISTGEFHFPNRLAAEIAINTVKTYKEETNSDIKVIFNVFKEVDDEIYRELLRQN
jgi:O-acetyl-ADP-ribose deacetylase (regulator of RNase III)